MSLAYHTSSSFTLAHGDRSDSGPLVKVWAVDLGFQDINSFVDPGVSPDHKNPARKFKMENYFSKKDVVI